MVNVHVAHDCQIKNNCILANNATLAGHVELDDFVDCWYVRDSPICDCRVTRYARWFYD